MGAGPGLSTERGVLVKDGRPFRAVGINYFSAFNRMITRPEDMSWKEGLALLREKGIPFVRFAACGFWPADWSLYQKDPDRYFALLDAFVREAERQKIGLVPSMFWYFATLPDLAGEPMAGWGDPASRTHAIMRQYVADVVGRYKDSPAIWAWEFGNEYRLQVDLPGPEQGLPYVAPRLGTPTTRTAQDKLERAAVDVAQREFARAVRRLDSHRLLITGESIPRPFAWHLMKEKRWERDTPEQMTAMLLGDNADPYDCLSIHFYPDKNHVFFEPPASLRELIAVCMRAAAHAGKPLFIGEFGASDELAADKVRAHVTEMLDIIVELRVPLSALWVYDLPMQEGTYNVTTHNHRAWMLDALSEANRLLQRSASSVPAGG